VRFKPPPIDNDNKIPWRVEFRIMETQPKMEDNLYFSIFTELMKRMICEPCLKFNFYMPISMVDENFRQAHQKNSILKQKFWFRKDYRSNSKKDMYIELTLKEFILGKKWQFQGMIQTIDDYFKL